MEVIIVKNNQNILVILIIVLTSSALSSSSFLDRKLFAASNKDEKIKELCRAATDTEICTKTLKVNMPKDIKDEDLNPNWAAKTATSAAQVKLNQVAAFAEQHLNERPKDMVIRKCKVAYSDLAKGLNKPIPNELAAVSEQASAGLAKLNGDCTQLLDRKDVNMPPEAVTTLQKAPAEVEILLENVVSLADEAELWNESRE